MSDSPSPAKKLYIVDFLRHPGDLGVSVILAARDCLDAVRRASVRFPEYKDATQRGHVYLLDYAEVDWNSGRTFVIRRRMRPIIPKLAEEQVNVEDEKKGGDDN